MILARLGLELHPDKTRRVELYDGKEGFDFLGCHLHKRMSGKIWERERKRAVYFLHRWPSQRSMKRIRQRVRELTPRADATRISRDVIADLNPVLRGWGDYFRTGNAASASTNSIVTSGDGCARCACKRKGRHLDVRARRDVDARVLRDLGLHRLRGTVRYPGPPSGRPRNATTERPPVSRVREIRTHGLNGGSPLLPLTRKGG